jgi:hypothetical protein
MLYGKSTENIFIFSNKNVGTESSGLNKNFIILCFRNVVHRISNIGPKFRVLIPINSNPAPLAALVFPFWESVIYFRDPISRIVFFVRYTEGIVIGLFLLTLSLLNSMFKN